MIEKYGYLGPKGTHSEEALNMYLGQIKAETVSYNGIEQVINAVKTGQVSHGLVPLENSIEGSVNLTLDLIAGDEELKIAGEVVLPVRHQLLTRPGSRKEEINLIISHPQALAQCRKHLNRDFPGVPVREVNSTAEAAQMVAGGNGCTAAIGNENAARNYGLAVTGKEIQDCRDNKTRFVVVSKEEAPVIKPAKTSLVISITDRPGGLYQILKEFALANLNLTRIESRPAKRNLGDYLFFIDLIGHHQDPPVKECLEEIRDLAASFRILGSYPVWGATAETDKYLRQPANLSVPEIRENIDIIDYQIVELLARRTQLVSIIGALKQGPDTVRDKKREGQILERVRKNAVKKGVSPELMEKVYKILFDHFVDLQVKLQNGLEP